MVGPTGLSDANRLGYTHRGLPEGAPHAIFHQVSFINNYEGHTMSSYTARTVPTQFVGANGIRFAYRRWGKQGGLPLVFNRAGHTA
jgi:hypothetical protein